MQPERLAMAREGTAQTMPAEAWRTLWLRPGNELWYWLSVRFNAIGDRVTFRLLDRVDLSGTTILDLGCGHARATMAIMQRYGARSLTAVDFCEEALQSVKRQKGDLAVRTVSSDLMSLDIDERFDLVFSQNVAEHFWGDLRLPAIERHARFAKKGGHVLMIVPGGSSLTNALSATWNKASGIEEVPFTREEINNLFAQAGLTVVDSDNLLFGSVLYTLGRKG
jgi:SAM-dependent methyltransferase